MGGLVIGNEIFRDPDLISRLETLGFVLCRRVSTLRTALELIDEYMPDLVLLDNSIKSELDGGDEYAGQDPVDIIQERRGIPVLIVSGRPDQERLDRRLDFETLLSDLSSSFVNISNEQINEEISLWLERLCWFLNVDRSGVHQFSRDYEKLVTTHSYALPGIEESPIFLTSKVFPWFTSQILAGRIVKLNDAGADLPPEASAEKLFVQEQGSKSIISIPLKIGDRVLGVVVFGNLRAKKVWSEGLVQRMTIIGEVFANALLRVRFEEALQESRERFRRAFEHAALGIMIFNPEGRIIEVNSFFCHLLGYMESDLLNTQLEDLIHPDDRKITKKRINQALAGEIQFIWMEIRYLHRTGGDVWGYASSTLLRASDGSPLYFVSHTQDISESKKSMKLLKETNTALRVVMDHRTQDRLESEKNTLATLEKLAFPFLEKLRSTPLDHEQQAYVDLLQENLEEIASPFVRRLVELKDKLTPTELQVADLIKRGNTGKEIASLMRISEAAVFFHRKNIRKKLGIRNKKTNLQAFLTDLH